MSNKEEDKMMILNMLSEGNINKDEALKLLDDLDSTVTMKSNQNDGKRLKILVNSTDGDKVNISIPIALAKIVLKAGKNAKVNGVDFSEYGIDIDTLIEEINFGNVGNLVDIVSSDGDNVQIFVE